MRSLILFLALISLVAASDRKPIRVTCRPVFKATVTERKPRCVTIDGIDYDLEPILSEYRRPWTWPGMTESSLRQHFANDHQTTGLDSLTFDELQKLHAVLHERETATTRTQQAPPPVAAPQSRCPGGVCPSPSTTGSRSRLFFRWR